MSDFLLVLPSGWSSIDLEKACSHPLISVPALETWIETGQVSYISELLIEAGALTAGQDIVEAKLIDGTYFFVLLR